MDELSIELIAEFGGDNVLPFRARRTNEEKYEEAILEQKRAGNISNLEAILETLENDRNLGP